MTKFQQNCSKDTYSKCIDQFDFMTMGTIHSDIIKIPKIIDLYFKNKLLQKNKIKTYNVVYAR